MCVCVCVPVCVFEWEVLWSWVWKCHFEPLIPCAVASCVMGSYWGNLHRKKSSDEQCTHTHTHTQKHTLTHACMHQQNTQFTLSWCKTQLSRGTLLLMMLSKHTHGHSYTYFHTHTCTYYSHNHSCRRSYNCLHTQTHIHTLMLCLDNSLCLLHTNT